MKDLKYLLAYLIPFSAAVGIYWGGIYSFATVFVAFGIIPFLELFLPGTSENLSPPEETQKLNLRLFDWLLYLNVPILYGLVFFYFLKMQNGLLETYETVGLTLSVGILIGTIGINVAHELGHRATKYEQNLSKLLLLPALYLHFFIEHNRGHHKNVATPVDPASSRLNESMYAFYWRSVTGGYRSAWHLEKEKLDRKGVSFWNWKNQMLRFQVYQLIYLLAIGFYFNWMMVGFAVVIAVLGFLLLESVNYIEHYGLSRQKLPSGRYEQVQPHHSWNSNHEVGRIMLYELTRHSDHHFKATRKYQILRHFDESPQLPLGYPGSIVLATVPPLWFKIMNKRVSKYT